MAAAATSIQQQQHPEEEEGEVSWAELPPEFVYKIMNKLSSSPHFMLDYIRFSSICTSWNFLYYNHSPPPQPPLLIVPPSLSKKKKHKTKVRRFYNVCDKKLNPTLQVSMPRYRHCRGSSHGWLITVDDHGYSVDHPGYSVDRINNKNDAADAHFIRLIEADRDIRFIRLFSPFLQGTAAAAGINEIVLSSLNSIPFKSIVNHYSSLKKAILSANPISNPTNYTVMAIYDVSYRLAFFKPGNKVWTDVKLPEDLNKDRAKGYFEDVIHWRGEFHAIHHSGRVYVCKEEVDAAAAAAAAQGGSGMEIEGFGQPLKIKYEHYAKKYLVVSSDGRKLMQVHRNFEYLFSGIRGKSQLYAAAAAGRTLYSTLGFRVFQLVMEGGVTDLYNWVEVKSLCGDTMFLGHNASLSISASNHPGTKPNCIYFTDDFNFHADICELIGPHDMGVFNLEDGSFERYFPIDPNNTSTQPVPIWPVPIWIQPTIPKCRSNNATSISLDEDRKTISGNNNSVMQEH